MESINPKLPKVPSEPMQNFLMRRTDVIGRRDLGELTPGRYHIYDAAEPVVVDAVTANKLAATATKLSDTSKLYLYNIATDVLTEVTGGGGGGALIVGDIDVTTPINYPAATGGQAYRIVIPTATQDKGRIGGTSGIQVERGDIVYALVTNAGGTQAAVGASWTIWQGETFQLWANGGVTNLGSIVQTNLIQPNQANSNYAISTGSDNNIGVNSRNSFAAGQNNSISNSANSMVFGGGVTISGSASSLAHGSSTQILSNCDNSIASGESNTISNVSVNSIASGSGNLIENSQNSQITGFNSSIDSAESSHSSGNSNNINQGSVNSHASGLQNTIAASPNSEASGSGNQISSSPDSAVSGAQNSLTDCLDSSASGTQNTITNCSASAIGGTLNQLTASDFTHISGNANIVDNTDSSIISGIGNIATVSTIPENVGIVLTGNQNVLTDVNQGIVTGGANHITTSSSFSVSGNTNTITDSQSLIVSGTVNQITNNSSSLLVVGSANELNASANCGVFGEGSVVTSSLNSLVSGVGHQVLADNTLVTGTQGRADQENKSVHSAGGVLSFGSAQGENLPGFVQTTTGAVFALLQFDIPVNASCHVSGDIVVSRHIAGNGAIGDTSGGLFTAIVKNIGGTLTLVNSSGAALTGDIVGATVGFGVNATSLVLFANGIASDTLNWSVYARAARVAFDAYV